MSNFFFIHGRAHRPQVSHFFGFVISKIRVDKPHYSRHKQQEPGENQHVFHAGKLPHRLLNREDAFQANSAIHEHKNKNARTVKRGR